MLGIIFELIRQNIWKMKDLWRQRKNSSNDEEWNIRDLLDKDDFTSQSFVVFCNPNPLVYKEDKGSRFYVRQDVKHQWGVCVCVGNLGIGYG